MYTSFFGLNEKPFSITPDPRYLFMSERHGEALAHLVYGVTESGGFVQLTGEVGTGKTTLVRTLLQNRLPDNADVAVVLNPQLSALEFLQTIVEELGVPQPGDTGSIKALIDALNHHLLMAYAEGRRTILVVDEAQNLARDVLEQVRLLTNLETSKQKLLQIILIGQPELRELLARNDLRQLAQRITGRYHLEPLSQDEAAQYIDHRVRVAGGVNDLFDNSAKREVYRLSQGVPRLINVICDRALLGAYGSESRRVTRRLVQRAAAEIEGKTWQPPVLRWALPVIAIAGIALVSYGAYSVYRSAAPAVRTAPALATDAPPPDEVRELAAAPDGAGTEPPAAAALPAEAPAPAQLEDELALASDLTTPASALVALFELWGVPADRAPQTCQAATAAGYECVEQRGSWTRLRLYDRPAILTLTDRRGDNHDVVLVRIHDETAELSIGGVRVEHATDAISELWFGAFTVIWQPVGGTSVALGPGSRHENVVWLRQSLAAIDPRYRADPLGSDVYDSALADRVRAFQRDHRLVVDGLAGRQTQIIVNSLTRTDGVPRLTTPRLAQD